jgi:hypothetical protein
MLNTDTIYTITAVILPLMELFGIIAAVHVVMNARPPEAPLRGIRNTHSYSFDSWRKAIKGVCE